MFKNAKLIDDGKFIEIHIPMKFKRRSGRKEIILPPGAQPEKPPTALQLALARAFQWQKMLDDGKFETAKDLAKHLGQDPALVGRTIRLTLLAPDIVEAILEGNEPKGLSLANLRHHLPLLWEQQLKKYGYTSSVI